MPPAAPQATRIRSRLSGIRTHWPRLEASAEPICTIGPSRPTEPPAPMHSADASALTTATCGRIRPPLSATAIITSGTPWPRASRGEPVDQRPVEQPADDRDDDEEPQAQPRQVRAGHPALLAELAVPGGQPGEEVDQVPERHRPEPGPGPDHQREHEQAAPRRPQPRRRPGPGRHARQHLADHRPSRLRPHQMAAAAASRLAPRSAHLAGRDGGPLAVRDLAGRLGERPQPVGHLCCTGPGSRARIAAISSRRRAVAWSTTCPPGRSDGHQHRPAVRAPPVPPDQALADQPVAHPPRRRRRHLQRPGQVCQPLRPPRGQHHQRPVLRDRGLLRRRAQRHWSPPRSATGSPSAPRPPPPHPAYPQSQHLTKRNTCYMQR